MEESSQNESAPTLKSWLGTVATNSGTFILKLLRAFLIYLWGRFRRVIDIIFDIAITLTILYFVLLFLIEFIGKWILGKFVDFFIGLFMPLIPIKEWFLSAKDHLFSLFGG